MNRVLRHLEYFPIELMVLAALGVAVIAVLFPRKYGVEAALIAAFAWLNLNRFQGLAGLGSIAKATYWLPLLALIYFAHVRPGHKQKVPALAWFYLAVPIMGCLCVLTATDAILGLVQFCNMFLMAAAAISVYRVVDSEQTLKRFLICMFIGLLVPLAISLSALVFFRAKSFRIGQGRFTPFGMVANQLAALLATAVSLAACGVVAYKSQAIRLIALGAAGISITLLIATGSRQGLVIVGIVLLPALAWLVRRPLMILPAAVISIGVGVWTFGFTEGAASTGRLTNFSDTSGRYETALQYVDTFSKRPVAGLLGTHGLSVLRSESAGHITHNSYLGMLYVGGLLLGAPLFTVLVVTFISMKRVLSQSRSINVQPTLLWLLATLLLAVYVHGLVNDMAYWSVSSWSFLHYFLSCFFIGLAQQVRAVEPLVWRQYRTA
jgi:hypothetical protein